MSEVTYSNVVIQRPSQPPTRQENETTKSKVPSNVRNQDLSAPSSSWKTIAVILGIICLMLILSFGVLVTKLVWKCPTCLNNWNQHGENCYYFVKKTHPWKKCQYHCKGFNSSFLKLNTEEELNFVKKFSKTQCDMQKEKFSISLYYSSKQLKWLWQDGTNFTLNKLQIPEHVNGNDICIFIKYGQIITEDCQTEGYCICKQAAHSD
ncbi:natural killer cells antigen CD94-like isoform X2 [Talpa occidentalis]|uniref:natural killer cells antigen CD94-like isoform X2 n=1 Tax=Talpa occidentalis TaxID=50954 RepID=UPI00188DFA44|nr:natural killer cells antigen CD94-like isoform X2 [Talpa occidentalis]